MLPDTVSLLAKGGDSVHPRYGVAPAAQRITVITILLAAVLLIGPRTAQAQCYAFKNAPSQATLILNITNLPQPSTAISNQYTYTLSGLSGNTVTTVIGSSSVTAIAPETFTISVFQTASRSSIAVNVTSQNLGAVISLATTSHALLPGLALPSVLPPVDQWEFTSMGVSANLGSVDAVPITAITSDCSTLTAPTQPQIRRDGTDITDTTMGAPRPPQSVVVGQQIVLTASLPDGATLLPWTVPSPTVGGFVVIPPAPFRNEGVATHAGSGHSIAADFTQTQVTFFWIVPDTYKVTLSCTLANGQTASVQATFVVDGPTLPNVTSQLGSVTVYVATNFFGLPMAYILSFGDDNGHPGIAFTASANLPTVNSGKFEWVQLIDQAQVIETDGLGFQKTCIDVSGAALGGVLDKTYPYQLPPFPRDTGLTENDTPQYELPQPPFIEMSYTFNARMFLMWNSTLPASISVPLGFTSWGFFATGRLDQLTHVWVPSGAEIPVTFQPITDYPKWNAVLANEIQPCFIRGVPILPPKRPR